MPGSVCCGLEIAFEVNWNLTIADHVQHCEAGVNCTLLKGSPTQEILSTHLKVRKTLKGVAVRVKR